VETISSVYNQTYQDWELILVDDGSTDTSKKICMQWVEKDSRISMIERNRQPKGASVCRNIGANNASGDYILFLDSDDLLAPYCLEQRAVKAREFSNLDFLVFPMLLFRNKIDDMRVIQNIPTDESALDRFLKRENVWLMSCPVWKASSFKKLGGFRENYLSFQDWEINVRALLENFNYRFFDEMKPDNFYRQNDEGSISLNRYSAKHNHSNAEMILDIWNIIREKNESVSHRRNYLAGFLIDVLNRYRFSELSKKERSEKIDYFLSIAGKNLLVTPQEKTMIQRFLRLSDSRLAYRFPWFRKKVDVYYKKNKLKEAFPVHERHQLKHIYNGELYAG
jgi:glycosyltransferase involved in cell wall biosynthesis